MTVFAATAAARTFDYQAGDVGYVPFAYGHYVENTGDEPLVYLEMFRAPRFEDISVTQWMGEHSSPGHRRHHQHATLRDRSTAEERRFRSLATRDR